MAKCPRTVLVEILEYANAMLGYKRANLYEPNERTYLRWKNLENLPTPSLAHQAGRALWAQMHEAVPGRAEKRDKIFAFIRERIPKAPLSGDAEDFGIFCRGLAEKPRRVDGEEPSNNKPAEYAESAALLERWDAAPQPERRPVPLRAKLELLARDPGTGLFTSVIEKPSLLPVKRGDELQLRVRLTDPAYICLVWLDQKGQPFPMYPWTWTSGDWSEPLVFQPLREVTVPATLTSAGHSDLIVDGPPGIETLILMCSLERPAADTVKALPEQFRLRSPGIKCSDLQGPVICVCTRTPTIAQISDAKRTPTVRQITDPVEKFQAALVQPLAACFDCVALLTFANAGPAAGGPGRSNR